MGDPRSAMPPDGHALGAGTREWLVPAAACPPLARLGIRLCGVSAARPGFAFARRGWDCGQVLVGCGGRGEVLVEGAWRTLEPGQAYLTPPGLPHAYRCPPGGAWTICWAILEAGDGRRWFPAGGAPAVRACDHRPLHDAIAQAHRELVGAHQEHVLALWTGLVAALVRRIIAPLQGDARLWRLWEAVDADLARPWSLADLARLAGVGPEQLRRRCRRDLGRSPVAHLAHLRLERARALLGAGAGPVADIARQVGYGDPFAFSAAFRRRFGRPPSACRP